MKILGKRTVIMAVACGLLLAGALGARGDENSDARFSGGSYDGYAVGAQLGAKLPPRGTIIKGF